MIIRYTIRKTKTGMYETAEERLLSPAAARAIGTELWLDGDYHDAPFYDRIGRGKKPVWDHVAYTLDYTHAIPHKTVAKLMRNGKWLGLPSFSKPRVYYAIQY